MDKRHDSNHLIAIFNAQFESRFRTRLVGGADEPLYQPASNDQEFHQVIFRDDYFASALHEIAHWCIAGPSRRQHLDYGYWYLPDGRDRLQQDRFEEVEVKPQALEWMLSVAAGFQFRVSSDNLTGAGADQSEFKDKIYQQATIYRQEGLPQRASQFMQALIEFYATPAEDVRFELTGF
jgi:elongation factor P hydroxylase